jgi:ParB family chromosome partitioning protein
MAAATLVPIALELIEPNPDQPRKTFTTASLQELADSIRERGLLQPIVVRRAGRRFQIIAGERRWRAHGRLVAQGHKRFARAACIIRNVTDHQRDLDAIVENLQRVDIEPLEEADAYGRLIAQGMTSEEIAKATGAALFRVNWRLQLLGLSPAIRKLFATSQIDRQQALELARLSDHHAQARVLRLINAGKLVGWKAVRNAVDALANDHEQADIFGELAPKPSAEDTRVVLTMERRIADVLDMVARGWRKGECVIAARVDLDRAALIADKLHETQKALRIMERELRNVTAQGQIALKPNRRPSR